jgi:23S rRNA (cytosine1962-C5)-methyltransferase
MIPTLVLKPGREKSLHRHHPWIFSGAIAQVKGEPQSGDTVAVRDGHGAFLAWAGFSPKSQIAARAWSFDERETIDADFFRRRLEQALAYRQTLSLPGNALRLVHGESDGLPGLVVDRYADVLVVQITAAGAEAWRDTLVSQLAEAMPGLALFERSDVEVRSLEGLAPRVGPLLGALPEHVEIEESGLRYRVDVAHGHKTGFYLDQRVNRAVVAEFARDREVLNGFCYTGGFTLAALAAGAKSILSVDSAADALEQARDHVVQNGLPYDRCEWREADMFKALRLLRDQGRSFDLIVLDPPKFAPTPAAVEKASRGYKDINLHAIKLLRPGGLLATYSCSGGITADLFQKIVFGAALDARAELRIVRRLGQSPDHPVSLNYPEGEYLKGLLLYRAG